MGRRYAELAFTSLVKKQQELHGSRRQYQRLEESGDSTNRLGDYEREFISQRDGFYMASVSETGWPYIQYRGGPKGFLRIVDDHTLGFVDLRGNKQYISVGNLRANNRISLFLMDYVAQQRLKILGRAEIFEGDAEAAKWIAKLGTSQRNVVSERAFIIHIEAFDWNCPQHITPRFTEEEVRHLLAMRNA
jgi:hypothetical protein